MSLTSYRAAPPRDKPLHALSEKCLENGVKRTRRPRRCSVPKGFLRRLPGTLRGRGCGRYVPTRARFGKGCWGGFFDFMSGNRGKTGPEGVGLARMGAKGEPWQNREGGLAESPLTRIAFRYAACDPASPRVRGEAKREPSAFAKASAGQVRLR